VTSLSCLYRVSCWKSRALSRFQCLTDKEGGTLDLHPSSGQRALKEAGIFEEFKRNARYDATVFRFLDKNATKLLEIGEGRDAPEIDRKRLRKILLDSIPKEKLKWGHGVKSVERDGDGKVVITFQNGSSASGFRLVVGADGTWSKVRHLVRPPLALIVISTYSKGI